MSRKPLEIFKNHVESDLGRYLATGASSKLKVVFFYQAFWATFAYRICRFLRQTFQNTWLHSPVALFILSYEKIIQIVTGISLPSGCEVGAGLYIAHFGGIIIHPEVKIGKNCNLAVQVVLGYGRSKGMFGYPTLGDRVFVGPGAKILGPVHIGDDAAIGANAVVTSHVPARAVVGGIPAKVIGQNGSFELVFYEGMESDEDRMKSLALASLPLQAEIETHYES